MGKNHVGNKVIIVGHYRQPSQKPKCKEELHYFMNNIMSISYYATIIIAGDFNQSFEETRRELIPFGLEVASSSNH